MCAMFADWSEEILRPTCATCHAITAPSTPAGLCLLCSEALAAAGDFGGQVPEAMISSATSEEIRQLTWVEVLDLGLHDFAPPEPEEQAIGGNEADTGIWELLPEAARSHHQEVPAAESLAESWEEERQGAELWSGVAPAEVLASASGAAEAGEGAGVQHVIAGAIMEEHSEATFGQALDPDPAFEWPELPRDSRQAQVEPQNSVLDTAIRRRSPDDDVKGSVDIEAPAASSSESQVLGQSLCIVCVKAAAVATFVHGLTGHTACCLSCAQEVQRRGCTCPVCRRPFTTVIRNFVTT